MSDAQPGEKGLNRPLELHAVGSRMKTILSGGDGRDLAMMARSPAVVSLILVMNATILYREKSPTHNIANRLPAKLST